jgi:hypothetical protein
MIEFLFNEGVKLHKEECCACNKRFIDISCDKLFDLYEKLVEEKNYVISDDDIALTKLSYDDSFECLICKNKVCYGCIMKMLDLHDTECDKYDGSKDNMEETDRITCPKCKTKDSRLKIPEYLTGGLFPEELLYDIDKNSKK